MKNKILQTFKQAGHKITKKRLHKHLKVDKKINYSIKMADDGGVTLTMLVPLKEDIFKEGLLKLLEKTSNVRMDGKTKIYEVKSEQISKVKRLLNDKGTLEKIFDSVRKKFKKDFKFTNILLVKMAVLEKKELLAELVYYGGWSE